MKFMKLTQVSIFALPLALGALTACGPDKDETPGEKTEDAVEEAGDSIEEGAEEVGDEIDDATE